MAHEQPSTLARYLFVAYVLLVVYASLHPFSGWRDRGLPPFAFLAAPFTRPMPVFDVVVNVIGYVPLGFLATLAAYPRLRGGGAFAFGLACSLLLSFALESLQLYLPNRRPARTVPRAFGKALPGRGLRASGSRGRVRERLCRGAALLLPVLPRTADPGARRGIGGRRARGALLRLRPVDRLPGGFGLGHTRRPLRHRLRNRAPARRCGVSANRANGARRAGALGGHGDRQPLPRQSLPHGHAFSVAAGALPQSQRRDARRFLRVAVRGDVLLGSTRNRARTHPDLTGSQPGCPL